MKNNKFLLLVPFLVLLALAGRWHTAHAQPSYNADVCDQGYVEREAYPGDDYCVTPKTHAQAIYDNMHNSERVDEESPIGALYGSEACLSPYVWRLARPSDHVCVTQQTQDQTAYDNNQWRIRLAHRFDNPKWWSEDYRIDWCLNWGKQCGQPAANNYCKRHLWTGARDFAADANIGSSLPTITSGSYKVCNESYCTGFKYITCYGKIDNDRKSTPPQWRGYRIDSCLHGDSECGKPAADAFCRNDPDMQRFGYSKSSFYYLVDPEPSELDTVTIGDGEVYDADKYTLYYFVMIICQ